MFAAADTLITLLIFAAIAIASWLQKKRKRGEEADPWGDGGGPPPPAPRKRGQPAPPRPSSWEEELRRLLQGEEEPPRPVARPQPAPRPQPAAKPPPIPKPSPRAPARVGELEKGLAVERSKLAESSKSFQRAKQLDQKVEAFLHQRGGSVTSASAYERASQLDLKVAERMGQVAEQTPKLPAAHRQRAASPEAAAARALLRDRRSVRSAVIASVILGPPRSLET